MHGSLGDGNVAEEANNISEDTDGDGVIVASFKDECFADRCDEEGFPWEFLRVAAIDEDET